MLEYTPRWTNAEAGKLRPILEPQEPIKGCAAYLWFIDETNFLRSQREETSLCLRDCDSATLYERTTADSRQSHPPEDVIFHKRSKGRGVQSPSARSSKEMRTFDSETRAINIVELTSSSDGRKSQEESCEVEKTRRSAFSRRILQT